MSFSSSMATKLVNSLYGLFSVVLMINLSYSYVVAKEVDFSSALTLFGTVSLVLIAIYAIVRVFGRKLFYTRFFSFSVGTLLITGVFLKGYPNTYLNHLAYVGEGLVLFHIIRLLYQGFIYDTTKLLNNILVTSFFFLLGAAYPYALWLAEAVNATSTIINVINILAGLAFMAHGVFVGKLSDERKFFFRFEGKRHLGYLLVDEIVADLLFALVAVYCVHGVGNASISVHLFGTWMSLTIGTCFFLRLFVSKLPMRVFASFNSLSLVRKLPMTFHFLLFLFFPLLIFVIEQIGFSEQIPSFDNVKAIALGVFLSLYFMIRFAIRDITINACFPKNYRNRLYLSLLCAFLLMAALGHYHRFSDLLFIALYGVLFLCHLIISYLLMVHVGRAFSGISLQKDLEEPVELSVVNLLKPLTLNRNSNTSLFILHDYDPYQYEKRVEELLFHSDPKVREQMIDIVEKVPLFHIRHCLDIVLSNRAEKGPMRQRAQKVIDRFSVAVSYLNSNQDFYDLIENSHDEYFLRVLARYQIIRKDSLVITKLFFDLYESVAREAMIMAGYLKDEKLLTSLVERMEVLRWNSIAKNAMVQYGDTCVTALSSYFDNKDVHYLTKIDIIDVLAKIGTEKAINEIAKKATNFQRDVVIVILGVLDKFSYRVSTEQAAIYNRILDDLISSFVLLNIVKKNLSKYEATRTLQEQVEDEITANLKCIIITLKLLYDEDIALFFYHQMEDKNLSIADRVLYDLKYPNSLKSKLTPVFRPETIFSSDLSENLLSDTGSLKALLFEVIDKDHLQTSLYLKALAIYSLKDLDFDLTRLTPLLFSRHRLIWETAAYVLALRDLDTLGIYAARLDRDKVKYLEKIHFELQMRRDPYLQTVLGIIQSLSSVTALYGVPELILIKYIDDLELLETKEGVTVLSADSCTERYFVVIGGHARLVAEEEASLAAGEIVEIGKQKSNATMRLEVEEEGLVYSISKIVMHQIVTHAFDKEFTSLKKVFTDNVKSVFVY